MKLYQLLQAYEFDEMMPVISNMYPPASRHRRDFQKAYELLLGLNPVVSKKSIRFKLLQSIDDDETYMGAEDACFNTTWEVCLGKEVVRERGVDLSDLEMTANSFLNLCLLSKVPKSFEAEQQRLRR